ncbi:MAG TPA: hypothetical protein PK867_25125, partial [Pirellulales bacterium]|nr:hypothetical protein [Pirellulales bacterium]
MLTDQCVYTIRHSSDLKASCADGGSGQYDERKNWQTAKRLLDAAQRSGKRLPIIFAPAERTSRLFGWALIDDITPGTITTYSFSGLQQFENSPAKSTLKKARDGKRLGNRFIRPSAICLTPS